MLEVLVEAALRSLVLATVVWLGLRLPGMRNRQIQLTAWTMVLAASLLMPVATRVASVVMPPGPLVLPDLGLLGLPASSMLLNQQTDAVPGWIVASSASVPMAGPAVMPDSPHHAGTAGHAGAAIDWPGWRLLASLFYVTVCGGLLIRLVVGLLLASRVVRTARPVHASWTLGHHVRVSDAIGAPATFGSVILLPHDYAGWSRSKRTAVLSHEAAHVVRHDFHVQIAASLNRAIFWFNPLSWWLQRKLSDLAEAASDDAAILDLRDRPAYAELLLEVAGRSSKLPAGVAMARPATVRTRVERILAETAAPVFVSTRSRKMLAGALVPLVVMAAAPLTLSPTVPLPDDTEQQAPHKRIAIDPKLLDADVGFYEDMKSGSVMIVTRDGDHLVTGRIGQPRYAEYPYTDYDFFLTDMAKLNSFVADPSGAVIRVVHRYNGLATVFVRISPETAQRLQADYDRWLAEERMPHTPVKLSSETLQDFAGYYQLTPTLIFTVTREGDQLFVETTTLQRRPVFPFDDHDFFYTTCAAQITFLKPPNGAVTALILHEDGRDRIAPRVGAEMVEQLQRRLDEERKPHAPVSIDAKLLDLYAGHYGNSEMLMTIARAGDHLTAQVMGFDKYVVFPYTDRDFFATASPSQISFVSDPQGKVIQLVSHRNGEDLVLRRLDQAGCSSEATTVPCS